MRRCPSFSSRPGFPAGLKVLLIDSSAQDCTNVRLQLTELSYIACPCKTVEEAVEQLASVRGFDICLAEARTLTPERSSLLIAALAGVPLLLMTSQGGSAQEVWRSIELGAEDCLEKPLSQLKLRNIWQHVVRKMMTSDGERDSGKKECGAPCSRLTATTPSSAAGSGPELSVSDGSSKRGEHNSSSSDPADVLSFDLATADSSDVQLAGGPEEGGSPAKRLRRSRDVGSESAPAVSSLGAAREGRSSAMALRSTTRASASPPLGSAALPQPVGSCGITGNWGGSQGKQSQQAMAQHEHQPAWAWQGPVTSGTFQSAWQTPACSLPSGMVPVTSSSMQRAYSTPTTGGCASIAAVRSCSNAALVLDGLRLLEDGDGLPARPPLGLQLKKSPSLLQLINEQLKHAA